jgi:predicted ABC-type transport system involved in lysophospholipase L1 biosynthesis ATPase subunit
MIFKGLHEHGRTVVLITHEEDVAAWADRIIRVRDGVIVDDEPIAHDAAVRL